MKVKKNKGQSIFEFILFLPIMATLYAFLVSVGGSINGAINQQKAVRGYFFARIKNNSTFPKPDHGNNGLATNASWQRFGMAFIGWRERWADGGQVPLTRCYQVPLPLGKNDEDSCEAWEGNTTQFIRPAAVFGVCGATYHNQGNNYPERDTQVSDGGACLIR